MRLALTVVVFAVLAAPAHAAAAPRCHTADLSAHMGRVDAGAGSRFAPLVVRNTSTHACTVRGYVGGRFVGHTTHVIRVTGNPVVTVALTPGKSAVSDMRWGAIPSGGATHCPTPSTLEVTPPDETTQLKLKWSGGMICGGYALQVKALRAQQ
jgi:hypothetical protein